MGKPKLTKQVLDEAIKLVENGATNRDVYEYIGVAEGTFYRWLREPSNDLERKLGQELKRAEQKRKQWCLSKIHAAAEDGRWQAAAWYLERRYPDEYAKTQRITGHIETTQRPDALTQAIEETVRQMESAKDAEQ